MAQSYQQTIELLVRGQNKLRAITDELKAANAEAEALKTKSRNINVAQRRAQQVLGVTGRNQPRDKRTGRFAKDPDRGQRLASLRAEREAKREQISLRRANALNNLREQGIQKALSGQDKLNALARQRLLNQTKLNAANDLYGRRLQEFARAGGNTNTELKQRVDQIRQAFEVSTQGGTENLQQIQAFNTELGRIVEKQRELNRLSNLRKKGFEKARRLQEKVDVIAQQGGATKGQIQGIRGKIAGVIQAAEAGNAAAYSRAVNDAVAGVTRLERESKKTRTEMGRSQKVTLSWNIALEQLNQVQQDIKRTQLSKELKEQNRQIRAANKITPSAFKDVRGSSKQKGTPFTRTNVGRAAVGAAFPALFGGGIGGIAGGGIGELLLGPLGGVIGSAIGSALDEAAQQVAAFGDALRRPTQNLEKLAQAAGIAGTAAAANIEVAQFLGAPEVAGTIAASSVESVIGETGAKGLENLGKESQNLSNNFSQLGSRIASAFAPALTAVSRFTNAIFFGAQGQDTPENRLEQQRNTLSKLEGDLLAGEVDGKALTPQQINGIKKFITITKEEISKLEAETERLNKANGKRVDAEKDISRLIQLQLAPLEAATKFEQNRLSLRRDTAAAEQGNLQILQIQADLDALRVREKQKLADAERQILNIQIQQKEEQERQAEAAKLNAIIQAQIQIERDKAKAIQRNEQAYQNILDTYRGLEEITLSDADNYEKKQETLLRQLDFQVRLKLEQTKMNLLTVTEQDLREDILRATAREIAELRAKTTLKAEEIRQNELIRQDSQQAIADARELKSLQQELSARREISRADPGRDLTAAGIGLGFFEGSVLLEANLIQDRTIQMQLFNEEVERLQNRLENLSSVDVEKRLSLTKQLEDLRSVRESYEKLQPVIDAARVRQQQFNDAFALMSPIVTSFIDGISEVAQGTKSAQEAFADFLRTIGDTLVAEGTRMIATYIAIGIAKAFAGLSGGGSAPDPFSSNVSSALPNTSSLADSAAAGTFSFSSPRANGGPVQGGQPYMVGERGPELFVPSSNGGVMRNEDMRQLMGRSPVGNAPAMNFTFETTNIGGQEFVSREQLEAAMATTRRQAANDGAKRGMNMTLDRMQNSPRTRARVGIA